MSLGGLRVYYKDGGTRSLKISDENAALLKEQIRTAAKAGWNDGVIGFSSEAGEFYMHAKDFAACAFRPDVQPPRYEPGKWKMLTVDLVEGSEEINGIASTEAWERFKSDMAAEDNLVVLAAGAHEIFLDPGCVASWKCLTGDHDFEDRNAPRKMYGNRHGGGGGRHQGRRPTGGRPPVSYEGGWGRDGGGGWANKEDIRELPPRFDDYSR